MNTAQLSINFDDPTSFVKTRARRSDCGTSRVAAQNAVSGKASAERMAITAAVKAAQSGATAREVAAVTGITWHETSRRISECGLTKTQAVRDGCRVWVAVR